jgi:hypothetical protein
MHIQTTPAADPPYKIWLETHGAPVVEKCGKVPARVFNPVREKLERDPAIARRIRSQWARQMIVKEWLTLNLREGRAMLVAYPGTNHEFVREIELAQHAPKSWFAGQQDVRLDDETAALMIGAQRPEEERILVDLSDVLWV